MTTTNGLINLISTVQSLLSEQIGNLSLWTSYNNKKIMKRINQATKVPKNLHWDRGTRKLLQLLIVGVAILYLIRHNTKVLNQISMTAAPKIRTSPRKVFVDLGANCGNTYLQRKKMFDAEGDWEIYLWEPSPQMHTFFLDDLARSNPDIVVVPYAAGI